MPVWADAFANEKQKSIWLTFLILASPLGVVFGFIMTSVFVAYNKEIDGCNNGWRWSFYVQCLLMTPMAIGFLLTPLKYLDIDRTHKYRDKCQ
jgi:MFS family permease